MMHGIVNAGCQARLKIQVQGARNQLIQCDAEVDTGCSGFLTLPATEISNLALPWINRVQAELADGSIVAMDSYEATVIWDGQPVLVDVEETHSDALVGMGLMRGYELRVEVAPGGGVRLARLP